VPPEWGGVGKVALDTAAHRQTIVKGASTCRQAVEFDACAGSRVHCGDHAAGAQRWRLGDPDGHLVMGLFDRGHTGIEVQPIAAERLGEAFAQRN
jgi:hypothetical protein